MEPLSAVLPNVASLLRLPEIHPPPSPLPEWYHVNLFCDFHRDARYLTDNCFTLRDTVQDLIYRKVISINTQEAASSSSPPSASPSTLDTASPNPSIVHQPLPEHSSMGGAGTSSVHYLFPSGPATSVVDPSDLIQPILYLFLLLFIAWHLPALSQGFT